MTIPNITVLIPYSGSNIDTSTIDGWRQGVEILQWKHFDAGIVKIRSGEAGHRLAVLNFGKDAVNEFTNLNSHFFDANNNNVIDSIIKTERIENRSYQVAVRESGNGTSNQTAGILEPLNKIRKLQTAIDANGSILKDQHDVKADTEIITSVFAISSKHSEFYQDDIDRKTQIATIENLYDSFTDEKQFLISDNFDEALKSALLQMTPEDWDYLAPNEKTGNCGQLEDYYLSTNSISFLGQTF